MKKPKELSFDIMTHHILSEEDICDLMTTALEGGINYWCGSAVGKLDEDGSYFGVSEEDRSKVEYISDLIAYDGELTLTDVEDPTDSWILTQDKFINGVKQFMISENVQSIPDLMDIQDADVADMIVQYALFDTIVFG